MRAVAAAALIAVVGLGAVVALGFLHYDGLGAAVWTHLAVGVAAVAAAAWASSARPGLLGTLALFASGVACLWAALFLGLDRGYLAWQSAPDPPDEAFADGATMVGALIFGWIPSAFAVAMAFLATGLVARWVRARSQARP